MIDEQRMGQGKLYIADHGDLPKQRREARLLTEDFNTTSITDPVGRRELLVSLFKQIGPGGYVEPPLRVDYGRHITVGKNFYANYETIMLDVAPITIGDNVLFGPRVSLLTPGHPLDAEVRNAGYELGEPITIGDNVWLGGDVTVCPGVTIGANTIVGAGAVVAKDLPANSVAVGNPAHVIREVGQADHDKWVAARAEYDADPDTQI